MRVDDLHYLWETPAREEDAPPYEAALVILIASSSKSNRPEDLYGRAGSSYY
jgi:hypothetical protein